MSWAHQRTRDLADQILDDAHSFRERCAARAVGLRRAGPVIAGTLNDVPTVCREKLEALAVASRRGRSNAVETTRELAWVVAAGGGWVRARRRWIVALATPPLIAAFVLFLTLSSVV